MQLFDEVTKGGSFSPGSMHANQTPLSPGKRLAVNVAKKALFAPETIDNEGKTLSQGLVSIMANIPPPFGSTYNLSDVDVDLSFAPKSPKSFSSCASPYDLAPHMYNNEPADLGSDLGLDPVIPAVHYTA